MRTAILIITMCLSVSAFHEAQAQDAFFYDVYTINVSDMDLNNFYENWQFEIDVDVTNGATQITSIEIWDEYGNDYGQFGPFSFTGNATDDNAIILFTSEILNLYSGQDIEFTFSLSQTSDTCTETVPVDWPNAVYFYDVYTINSEDNDSDGYHESWQFEVDLDVTNGQTHSTHIRVRDSEGNDHGWFGPFAFNGTSTTDNAIIPFNIAMLNLTNPNDIVFAFETWSGNSQETETVPVDATDTFFFDVYTVNTVDDDQDGYYESWDFEIDVDVSYAGTQSTSISITDDQGNDYGFFGPFTFVAAGTNDNVFISFHEGMVNLVEYPRDVVFTFTLTQGGDTEDESVPVDAPRVLFDDVYTVNTSDTDQDGYYDSWTFEVAATVDFMGLQSSEIHVTDDEGNDWGWFGPFTFFGQESNDNALIGPFSSLMINPDQPPEDVVFTFTLSHGGDIETETVPIDVPDVPYYDTFISDIYVVNIVDEDSDGFLESWEFEIDVDVQYGGTQSTNILVTDDEGNDYGSFGPYTFTGQSNTDNVTIGPFTASSVNPGNPPEDVVFTMTLTQSNASQTETVPVDAPPQTADTYISSLQAINTEDIDADSYYENWEFRIDVDVANGGTQSTSIAFTDDESNSYGPYGPYTFTGQSASDAKTLGSFTAAGVNPDNPPEPVLFTFTLLQSNDTDTLTVPVDDPSESQYQTYIDDISIMNIADSDSNGYFESWSFQIDVNVTNGGTQSTNISIIDDEGNTYGPYGPYTFTGEASTDGVILAGFTAEGVNSDAPPEDVVFTFTLSQSGDTASVSVPVDDPGEPPAYMYFYNVWTTDPVDTDGDEYYESWSFLVDINLTNDGTQATSILITDSEGNDYGSFGPYTFTGLSSTDNVVLGPFTAEMVDPDQPPEDVIFTFKMSQGSDTEDEMVPVDDPEELGIENDPSELLPADFCMAANYPNPFRRTTTIFYSLPEASQVRLAIYDVGGKLVDKLDEGLRQAGNHSVMWEATGSSPGIYMYRIQAGDFSETRRCLLIK